MVVVTFELATESIDGEFIDIKAIISYIDSPILTNTDERTILNFNKNNAIFGLDWDLIVIDEAHEGTQTELGDNVIKHLRKIKRDLAAAHDHRVLCAVRIHVDLFEEIFRGLP